jgi:hypothetical protein
VDVQLEEYDRIVFEYKQEAVEGLPHQQRVIVAYDDVNYLCLWEKAKKPGSYSLMWRGTWEQVLREFRDIVGDCEHDYLAALTELRKRAEQEQS